MIAPTALPVTNHPGRRTVRTWRRLRWAVRATLLLGVIASIAANVLHAQPHPISQAIAAWPSFALLLTVELIARIPVTRAGIAVLRLTATTTVAGIAAWVSYWHMAGVAARYGETGITPYLLPLSVDGLILIASISLLEISTRIRTVHTTPHHEPAGRHDEPADDEAIHDRTSTDMPSDPPPPADPPRPDTPRKQRTSPRPPTQRAAHPSTAPATGQDPLAPAGGHSSNPPPQPASGRLSDDQTDPQTAKADPPDVRVPAGTAEAVAYWHRKDPQLQAADIGRLIGKSERTVYRHLTPKPTAGSMPPDVRASQVPA